MDYLFFNNLEEAQQSVFVVRNGYWAVVEPDSGCATLSTGCDCIIFVQ
jgi:hypothetical protein